MIEVKELWLERDYWHARVVRTRQLPFRRAQSWEAVVYSATGIVWTSVDTGQRLSFDDNRVLEQVVRHAEYEERMGIKSPERRGE